MPINPNCILILKDLFIFSFLFLLKQFNSSNYSLEQVAEANDDGLRWFQVFNKLFLPLSFSLCASPPTISLSIYWLLLIEILAICLFRSVIDGTTRKASRKSWI